MANELIPPQELAPSIPPEMPMSRRIEVWLEWLDICVRRRGNSSRQ